jgi:hypothetical protein
LIAPLLLAGLAVQVAAATPFPPGRAIVADGRFEAGEWADAERRALPHNIVLATKRTGDRLLLAVMLPPGQLRYLDLYVADRQGQLRNLHASMQQGERLLPQGETWDDRDPAFTWGRSEAWRTNIVEHSGAPPDAPVDRQLRAYQGFEMDIPLAHLGPGPWRIRLEIRDFRGEAPDIAWPAGSTRHDRSMWLEIASPAPLTSH